MIFEERQIEKNNFSSRAIILFVIIILSLLAVLIQVFTLQISGYNDYQLAALKNKNYKVPMQALRGEIFDRNGKVLIKNEPTFDLITQPNLIDDIDSFLDEIQPVIFLSESDKFQYKKLQKEKAFANKELVLKKDLSAALKEKGVEPPPRSVEDLKKTELVVFSKKLVDLLIKAEIGSDQRKLTA